MNKLGKYLKHLCAVALVGFPMLSYAEATMVNLAQKVCKVTVSVNAEDAALVNDNGRVACWSTEGADLTQYHYVEMEWSATSQIVQTVVYWARPNSYKAIALPTDAYLCYWDGEAWSEGISLNEIDESNVTTLENTFETKKMRIYMKSDSICGLREVRILGYERVVPGELYEWPAYSSQLNYNYRNDYPNGVEAPTKALPENINQAGSRQYGWWNFVWGPNRNKYVTDEAIDSLLRRMDRDFGYFRDVLGWLPDKRASTGIVANAITRAVSNDSDEVLEEANEQNEELEEKAGISEDELNGEEITDETSDSTTEEPETIAETEQPQAVEQEENEFLASITQLSASASANANVIESTLTDDKADRKLSRFNTESIIESKKKMKKVQAVSASSGGKA